MEITIPTSGLANQLSQKSRVTAFLAAQAPAILAVFPLLVLIWVVARYAVDVPYLDQWEIAPLMGKMYEGQLTFHDVWAQFNEHRCFFPEAIMLGLAKLTGWDIRVECGVCVLLALGIFLLLVWQVRTTARVLGIRQLRWGIPACSLIVFSISQFENFLWGWQITLLLGLLASLGAILLIANHPTEPGKLAGAIALGFIATFSFGNGVLVWPIGLLLLMVLPAAGHLHCSKWRAISVWATGGGLTLWLCLRDYTNAHGQGLFTIMLHKPLVFAAYILKFIGGACAQYGEGGILRDKTWALILGSGGVLIFAWAVWNIARRMRSSLPALAPYLALCAYSLGTAFLAATARADFGPGQALCSRYCSLTAPLWFSMIILLIVLSQAKPEESGNESEQFASGSPRLDRRRLSRWLLFGVVAFLACSSAFAIRSASEDSRNRAKGRRAVLALKDNPMSGSEHNELWGLSDSPRVAAERAAVLMKHHLSAFRE